MVALAASSCWGEAPSSACMNSLGSSSSYMGSSQSGSPSSSGLSCVEILQRSNLSRLQLSAAETKAVRHTYIVGFGLQWGFVNIRLIGKATFTA